MNLVDVEPGELAAVEGGFFRLFFHPQAETGATAGSTGAVIKSIGDALASVARAG